MKEFNSNIIRRLRKLFSSVSPLLSNKIMYRFKMKKKLNIKNPKTFNEKINYMKLYIYPSNKTIINCTDKYKVREYITSKGYKDSLNELYGVYDSVDEINWNDLPNSFVLKCNHGAGYNIICPDKKKLDYDDARKKLKKWLKEDFGKVSAEPHYSKINRKIICEKFLEDEIKDYKFYCFKGEPVFFYISQAPNGSFKNLKVKFFFTNGKEADFKRNDHEEMTGEIVLPKELEKMEEMARVLSSDFEFVRVDLFNVKGKVYFSELTFSPCSGFMPFSPSTCDLKYGNLIDIRGMKK